MNSRITLSRILAVNWYGYRQFIDISGLTLITGANESGKSVLLDLIQFVLLGEQQSRFNKAAAGTGNRNGRSLRGYCLCDTNTTGRDGAERYLRPSGVTLAALEFTWPLKPGESEPRRETWGARIEYESPTAKPSTIWFRVGRRFAWQDFLNCEAGPQAMQFMPADEFRTRVKRELDGDVWDRQKAYLDEMALRSHLGFDSEQMGKTLPRAMAFEPESNFEKFVREFLLEPGMPDVKAVKASVDAHRSAQKRLEKMYDQLERLKHISGLNQDWITFKRESALYAHLSEALKHEEALENLATRRAKLDAERDIHASNQQDYERSLTERDELRHQVEAARSALGDKGSILEANRCRRRDLEKEIKTLTEAAKTAREFLRERARRWDDWLKHASALGLSIPENAAKELATLRGHNESKGLIAANKLVDVYFDLKGTADEKLTPLESKVRELENRTEALRRDLDNLRKGHAAPSPLLNALKARGQHVVALGRIVEVKPEAEAWWPLLEALLGQNRQAILAEDFRAAFEVAQKTPHGDEPLIHGGEVAAATPKLQKGSLRDFLETKHTTASKWLDMLLGDVMPVKTSNQFEKHERALSLDGWLKDPPRRLRLTPEKELTLGEEGMRRLRELRENDLRNVETEIALAKRERDDWRTFLNRAREWRLNDPDAPEGTDNISLLPKLKDEAEQLDNTYELLATPDRLEALENLRRLEASFDGVKERLIRLDERMRAFKQFEREQADAIAHYTEQEEQTLIVRQISRMLVRGISDEEIAGRIVAERQKSTSWRKSIEMAATLALQLETRAQEAHRLRDEQRRDLVLEHKDIGEALDPEELGNEAYDQRREDLETHELERYRGEADIARQQWEDRLQHQVLDVLREKLSEADRTKRELNRAMDHEIGGWCYQLTSRADKAHSVIWTLVEKGLPSGAEMELFNSASRDDIERAKAELMAAIDAADNPEDERHQRALDYRYYHHWDIEAKPVGRSNAAAISLNKSATKQSGGGNQGPFFVATLAAFRRVYDLGRRDDPQNLGLVVMDEAFSKLSGDRIDDCLAMARNFGLQLIMAFPEDRLPTMFQHADTVVQCRVERSYDEETEQVQNIENWVVRVEGSRLAELME